jgi:alcohol dehydrogenase class IV
MTMQQILRGIGYLEQALADSHKVLLVCDSSFPFLSIREDVERLPIPMVKFDGFTPNPLYEDVCKGVEIFKTEQCDAILAVGGGSSLDVAKCIKLYCRMDDTKLFLDQPYEDTGIPLVAIPTTAGTGSESTRFAVIYYEGKKQSITHPSIIPDVAILEPRVLKTLPLYQKKCTMLDALCQGIESWWSVNSTVESKAISKKAVETIMAYWREYIFDNTNLAAERIMEAANLAGQAICITQTTAAHAFSYKITSLYHLPHGHAVAVCLPEIWTYMDHHPEKCIDSRGADYVNAVFLEIAHAMGCDSVEEAVACFRGILEACGMTNPQSVDRDHELKVLAESVNPVRLKNNPVKLDAETARAIYAVVVKK